MGWTVHYAGRWASPLSEAEIELFRDHAGDPRWRLSRRCEPYRPVLSSDGSAFHGHTKIEDSAAPARDYRTIIAALRDLDRQLPGAEIHVRDDHYLGPTALAAIDLDALASRVLAGEGEGDERARRESYRRRLDREIAAAMSDPEIARLSPKAKARVRRQLRDELMEEADHLGLYLPDGD